MRISIGSSTASLLAGVIATLWLQGAAWAGDAGEDLGGLTSFLKDTLCPMVGISMTSCPQFPTISQALLEIAALENASPAIIEALNNVDVGNHPDAANPARGGVSVLPQIEFPLTVATLPDLLSTLTPLAFISAPYGVGPATATQPNDPSADTFLYAVASGSGGPNNLPTPNMLYFFYDDTQQTNRNLSQRQVVAEFSFPLTVLTPHAELPPTERLVQTTLQFSAPSAGSPPCSAAIVRGDFLGDGTTQTKKATDIGLNCAVVFAPSPSSADPHAIFQLQVPLLVTRATDLTYFFSFPGHLGGPISLLIPTAFITDAIGFMPQVPGILEPLERIGIGPSAAPQLCNATTCPIPPATPPTPAYSLCANLPRNHNKKAPVPAVAAFYAIATDGETHLLAPIVPSGPVVCPF